MASSLSSSSSSSYSPLLNLPDELHLRILHFAGWRAAITLGLTCRRLHYVCDESTFWHRAVTDSFRMRLGHFSTDGNWKAAFKRLVTGRFYGWGQNWNLMFSDTDLDLDGYSVMVRNSPWPKPLEDHQYQGVVDVQSGGWCVCLLTLAGSIIVGGALDGTTSYASRRPRTLQFPLPDIHIQQISCGRSHLLALSTDGGIWSVRGSRSSEDPALIKFVTEGYALESHPNNEASAGIDMRKVVAGWSASGALVKGAGIFVWFDDLPNGEEFESSEEDPRWVRRVAVKEIPFFSWPTGSPSQEYAQDPVVDFAIGENFIVFVTSLGKVFVQNVTNIHNKDRLIAPMELLNFTSTPPINRVEGSFRKFAVFNENGLVHIMDATGLEHAFSLKLSSKIPHSSLPEMQTDAISPLKVPELHNHRIVDVAFGDWHCLALTDRGKVFSWGTESRSCGSLGLGPPDIAAKRGVNYQPNREGMLAVPQEVTFSFSPRTTDFSYKISAAGWHSCALVAQVEADSTLAIGEFQEAFDGACESTETHDHRANPPTPKNPHNPPPNLPKTERGHRGGISGMPSDARGMVGGLADGTMAKGGESLFGLKEGIIAKETKVLIGRAEEAFGQAEDAIERAEDTVVKESETFIERVEASIDQGQEAVFGAPSKRASTSALGTPQVVESQKWLWKKRAGSAGASKTSLAEQEPARE